MFPDHNGIKLEIINRKMTGKFTNTWKPNSTLLNNLYVKGQLSKEMLRIIHKHTELNENENTAYQNMCSTTKAVKRVNL